MGCPGDEEADRAAPYRVRRWADEVTADERNVMRHRRRGAECAITTPRRLNPDRVITREGGYQPTEAVVKPLLKTDREIGAYGEDGRGRPRMPKQGSDAPLGMMRARGPTNVDDGE